MSAKNILQEVFQKRRHPLPKYETCRAGGEAHAPKFVSRVTLSDGLEFVGEVCNSKTLAELSAAEKAMEYINNIKAATTPTLTTPSRITVLIDTENKPIAASQIRQMINCNIVEYMSKNSPLVASPLVEGVVRRVVPSSRKDSADIGMTLDILSYLTDEPDYLVIITSDHFGDTIAECCREGYINYGKTIVKCFPSVNMCKAFLESLG